MTDEAKGRWEGWHWTAQYWIPCATAPALCEVHYEHRLVTDEPPAETKPAGRWEWFKLSAKEWVPCFTGPEHCAAIGEHDRHRFVPDAPEEKAHDDDCACFRCAKARCEQFANSIVPERPEVTRAMEAAREILKRLESPPADPCPRCYTEDVELTCTCGGRK